MAELKHKKPCNDCPFRRDATPGWLGDTSGLPGSEEVTEGCKHFVDGALADYAEYDLPCHTTIDYEKGDWLEDQYPEAALCAGALIFARNQAKSPRDPARAENIRQVEADTETVFAYPWEFYDHHGGELPPKWKIMKRQVELAHEGKPTLDSEHMKDTEGENG